MLMNKSLFTEMKRCKKLHSWNHPVYINEEKLGLWTLHNNENGVSNCAQTFKKHYFLF